MILEPRPLQPPPEQDLGSSTEASAVHQEMALWDPSAYKGKEQGLLPVQVTSSFSPDGAVVGTDIAPPYKDYKAYQELLEDNSKPGYPGGGNQSVLSFSCVHLGSNRLCESGVALE